MSQAFFTEVPERVPFGGPDSTDPLAFAVYEPDRLVLGTSMADHLRIGVCLWHSFAWPGSDVFGVGTFDRPWLAPGLDLLKAAEMKLDAAFECIGKLGVRSVCVHRSEPGATPGHTFTTWAWAPCVASASSVAVRWTTRRVGALRVVSRARARRWWPCTPS